MFKKNKLHGLQGDIPLFYNREAIFTICVVINRLVKEVNRLSEEVERLSQIAEKGGTP